MADGGDLPSGRIRRDDADQILIAALIAVCCRITENSDMELALHLVERALPLASAASRTARFKPVAAALLRAAPLRRRVEGSVRWATANMELRQILQADALQQAVRRVEV